MIYRKLEPEDEILLYNYFHNLSAETKSRYGPHPFDRETIGSLCRGENKNLTCYVCILDDSIIAYSVLKKGYLDFELPRLSQYPISLDHTRDYTLAPSVADGFQSKGIGTEMMNYVFDQLKLEGAGKIVLWGGVQESNEKALRFYLKHGFRTLGQFDSGISNLDMVKELHN